MSLFTTSERWGRPLAVVALALGLAACNGDPARQPFTIAVTTPNGEPLPTPPLQGFDSPGCPAILGTWFDRADSNHDGMLDRAEFLADAEAQFARMDLNHDGIITPGVLQQYRAGIEGHNVQRPPGRSSDLGPDPETPGFVQIADASGAGGFGSGKKGPKSLVDLQQGGGGDQRSEPDPVMSADTGLHFQVTKKDFMDQAVRRFVRLDLDHAGRLTRPQAMLWCVKRVRWPEQAQ